MIEWHNEPHLVDYPAALAAMETHVDAMIAGKASEKIWLLEHPPLYTGGTSADPAELLTPQRFPVFETGRGGRFTYHGPGQRVAYVMADLRVRGRDVRAYVHNLEAWVINALQSFGVDAGRREGRIGLWVVDKGPEKKEEKKIAAIGVRIRKWVAYHGVSININPDLSHFAGIVPCGLSDYGVTSLHDLGINATVTQMDEALKASWNKVF
ncbi:MAG: lipoyl(octanoyl) transferase LipB [Alphaproteobacteria bacterium]|nr:lipoyl(octanoyl) transferase LipB [Alphaproteobacteria bacterium]